MSKILSIAVAILLGMSSYDGYKKLLDIFSEPSVVQTIDNLPLFSTRENLDSVAKYGTNAMVRILDNDNNFICTGTVISSKYVLTAAHCLYDSSRRMRSITFKICIIETDTSCVEIRDGKAAAIHTETDNGLILGDFSNLSTYKLNLNNDGFMGISQKVVTCGFPWGRTPACYGQKINPKHYLLKIAMEGSLYPGMSGGPVFDLDNQHVIGVNSGIGQGFILVTTLVGLFEQLNVPVE